LRRKYDLTPLEACFLSSAENPGEQARTTINQTRHAATRCSFQFRILAHQAAKLFHVSVEFRNVDRYQRCTRFELLDSKGPVLITSGTRRRTGTRKKKKERKEKKRRKKNDRNKSVFCKSEHCGKLLSNDCIELIEFSSGTRDRD